MFELELLQMGPAQHSNKQAHLSLTASFGFFDSYNDKHGHEFSWLFNSTSGRR